MKKVAPPPLTPAQSNLPITTQHNTNQKAMHKRKAGRGELYWGRGRGGIGNRHGKEMKFFFFLSLIQANKQTNRPTDRLTDRQTDTVLYARIIVRKLAFVHTAKTRFCCVVQTVATHRYIIYRGGGTANGSNQTKNKSHVLVVISISVL